MAKDLNALFCPKSIALVGASRSTEKLGAIVLKNIIDSKFKGGIYPINPNTDRINGLKCYPDIKSLPEVPDLAVIAIPSALVSEALINAGEKGVRNAVVFSAGYKEIGAEGQKLEDELKSVVCKYEINLLGPNCLGFVNNLCPVNVTFGQPGNSCGNLRFIMQSGAIGASLFDWCKSSKLSFSQFITLGNKTDINENDVLDFFLNNSQNDLSQEEQKGLSNVFPIGLYLESIVNGAEFMKITAKISQTYPIFIIKPGKTKAAAKAMQSHTGAIAGEDTILEAAFNQSGIIRCQTLQEFFDLSKAFAWENAPSGSKVAIISNAGGPAVISADAVIKEGLELNEFSLQIQEKLMQVLPRSASVLNPVDVLGDALADRFAKAAEIVLQTNQVDALIVVLTPQVMTQIEKTAQFIYDLSRKYQKPIFCSFIGGNLILEAEQKLNEYRIPSFHFPEQAIFAVGSMWRWKQYQTKTRNSNFTSISAPSLNLNQIKETLDKAVINNQKTLDNFQANEIMFSAGMLTPKTLAVVDLNQAQSFAHSSGWPVVLKLSSSDILHKADLGGVITGLTNDSQLETGWKKIQEVVKQIPGNHSLIKIQIQKEIEEGIEVIVGVKRDPSFGLVLLFGAGGTFAEVINDRNLHLLPIRIKEAEALVKKSKIYNILKGYRGKPALALEKLYDLIIRFGKLAEVVPETQEMEINPVIVTTDNAWVVDPKVILKQKS